MEAGLAEIGASHGFEPREGERDAGGAEEGAAGKRGHDLAVEKGFGGDDFLNEGSKLIAIFSKITSQGIDGALIGEVERASEGVGEKLRGEGAGELVLSLGEEHVLEASESGDGVPAGKDGAGVDRLFFLLLGLVDFGPEEADGVVVLQRDAPGIDGLVAVVAGCFLAVVGELLTDREIGEFWVPGLEFRDIGRGRIRRIVEEGFANPDRSIDRVGVLAAGVGKEDGGVGEESAGAL